MCTGDILIGIKTIKALIISVIVNYYCWDLSVYAFFFNNPDILLLFMRKCIFQYMRAIQRLINILDIWIFR